MADDNITAHTLADLHAETDPSIGLLLKIADHLCLFGFRDLGQDVIRVDISTTDGEDRSILIDADSTATLASVINTTLVQHGGPSMWPVWASPEHAAMLHALESDT